MLLGVHMINIKTLHKSCALRYVELEKPQYLFPILCTHRGCTSETEIRHAVLS